MLADAEVIGVAFHGLRQLGFNSFRILLNNRKILRAIANQTQIPEVSALAVWRAVDKWDKIGPDGVRGELDRAGLPAETVERLFRLLDVSGDSPTVLRTLAERLDGDPAGLEGIRELDEIIRYLTLAEVPPEYYRVDLHMVRGLDYYTGPIYEVVVDKPKIGTITAGGRYDHLVGQLGAQELPAVGISLGMERLIDVIDELGMAPPEVRGTVTEVLVTVFDADYLGESLATAESLRATGVNTEVYLGTDRLGNQLRYASRKNIPLAVILGPDEISRGEAVLRNMATGQQQRVERGALLSAIRGGLAT
jgi:histidyl-tRNA synthetase